MLAHLWATFTAWRTARAEARARHAEERRKGERIARMMQLTADKALSERRWG